MATTNFVAGTLIESTWLNDVDAAVYDGVILSDTITISTKTPASATDTGTTGMIAWDSSYLYVCVATNTWKRSAISTW